MRVIISKYSFFLVVISFFIMIIIGAGLLSLPGVLKNSFFEPIDAFFISTSVIAGIGVTPINICHFSTIGKIIIMLLMYIGNIGILIVLLGIIFYFTNYSVEWYGLSTELFTIISIRTISYLFRIIFISAILVQLFGVSAFYLLSKYLSISFSFIDVLFVSLNFFCNVGIPLKSILPKIMYTNIWYYCISSIIIIFGSCGFLLLFECQEYIRQKMALKNYSFSCTSQLMCRIYLYSTGIFWLFYFVCCESNFSLYSLMRSLFASISFRSCGMSPYYNPLHPIIAFISALYGLCGAGVLGPCGGMKSSVLGIIIYTFIAIIKKEDSVIIYNRKISWQLISFAHIFLLYTIGLATIVAIIIDILQCHKIEFLLVYSDILGFIGSGSLWSSLLTDIGVQEKLICMVLITVAKIAAFGLSLYLTKLKKSELQYTDAKLIII